MTARRGDSVPLKPTRHSLDFLGSLKVLPSLVSSSLRTPELTSAAGGWSRYCCVTAEAGGGGGGDFDVGKYPATAEIKQQQDQ